VQQSLLQEFLSPTAPPVVRTVIEAVVQPLDAQPAAPPPLVLRGKVVTMTGQVLDQGVVYLKNSKIAAVQATAAPVPAGFQNADTVDTGGVIYPGLLDLHNHLAKGETEKAEQIKTFYDEYFAVMDLPAEFYIETVRDVFQEHLLPQGKLTYRGRKVDPAAIRRLGLMTVEGEKDDICSIGQTLAAQDLCTGVRAYRRVHHMQAGVGHYGVFSGKKWNNEIYPLLRDFVHVNS